MIKDSWSKSTFKCGNCEKSDLKLDSKFNYTCDCCKSSISYLVIEKILEKVSELENDKYLRREIGVLDGTEFTIPKKAKCLIESDDGIGAFVIKVKPFK